MTNNNGICIIEMIRHSMTRFSNRFNLGKKIILKPRKENTFNFGLFEAEKPKIELINIKFEVFPNGK